MIAEQMPLHDMPALRCAVEKGLCPVPGRMKSDPQPERAGEPQKEAVKQRTDRYEESGGWAEDQGHDLVQGDQDHPGSDALDPAFCDGEHTALHCGVVRSGDGTPKLGSAFAPLARHPLGGAEDQDRQVVEEDGR